MEHEEEAINLLRYIQENDIIDMSYIQAQMELERRNELLNKHPYKIWEGSDGKWRTYLPDEAKGRILKKRTRKEDLEDEIIEYWEEKSQNPTIEEVFTEWNERRVSLGKISEATSWRMQQVFNRHFDEFGKRRIRSISGEEISDFLEEQISRFNLTSKAFSNLKTVTRGLLKRAKKRNLLRFNVEQVFQELDVSDRDFRKIVKEDYEEVYDEEETPIIMGYLEKNTDIVNLGILLMFVTGARVGEVVALKHCDLANNAIRVRRTETRCKDDRGRYIYKVKDYPKTTAGIRTVVLPSEYEWLFERIQAQNPNDEFVFTRCGIRINTQTIRRRLKLICDRLGIYPKPPHKIRKTYGTILMDNNIDDRLITEQMGHTDILCSERFYHRNRRSLERKREIISSIPDFSVRTGH